MGYFIDDTMDYECEEEFDPEEADASGSSITCVFCSKCKALGLLDHACECCGICKECGCGCKDISEAAKEALDEVLNYTTIHQIRWWLLQKYKEHYGNGQDTQSV